MTDQLDVVAARETSQSPIEVVAEPSVGEYRYPGAPPFADSEMDRLLFRGRASEIDQVLHSILSFDLFLIYAISGLGKTSLLSAGVMERLRQRDFFPVLIRLNDPDRSPVELIDEQLREAASKVDGITVMRNPSVRDVEGPPSTLWDLLNGLEVWKGNTLQHPVLMFDQFEELFTLGWTNDQRAQFIEQFGQVVRRHRTLSAASQADPAALLPPPSVKITLIIREDFLGELEAMAQQVPQIMRHRFRLDGLLPEQAELAIREPACINDPRLATPQFVYSEGAAHAILAFLGARQDRGRPVLTNTIDPSQLQIICQHVERSILPSKSAPDGAVVEISEDDLGGRTGLDRILRDFYRREIASFPSSQRKIVRNLCETGLINQRGRRLSLEEEEIGAKYKVSKATLEDLVARRLLRAEPRVGSVYYELAHDTLAAPILAYREGARNARRRHWLEGALVVVAAAVVVIVLANIWSGNEQASASAGEPIHLGDVVTGTIEGSGQSRLFAFDAPGNQTLVVEAKPKAGDNLDAVLLKVIEPDGRTDTGTTSEGGPQTVVVGGAASGRYLIVVSGFGSTTTRFELSVRPADVTEMVIGDAKSGTIEKDEPARVFTFDATEAQPLTIEVKPKTGEHLDPVLEVTDPTGFVLTTDSGGEGGIETSVLGSTANGRYLVVVDGYGSTVGEFELSVRPAAVLPLTIGQPEPRTLDASNPVKLFAFEATDSQPLTVEVDPDAALDVAVQVTDPNGQIKMADNDIEGATESLLVGASVNGRYLVWVSGRSPGAFEVTVRSAEAQEVDVGGTAVSATDDSNLTKVFTFEALDTQPLTIEADPDATLDVVLEVTDPDGYVNAADNDVAGGTETLVVRGVPGGRYVVRVTGLGTGTFDVAIRSAEAQEVAVGEAVVSAGLTANDPSKIFTFETTDAQPLTVEIEPDVDLDVVLQVTEPNGEINVTDNAIEGGIESLVVDGVPNGRYVVVVRSRSSGAIQLSVNKAAAELIAVGDSTARSIDSSVPVRTFEFEATETQTLIIEAKSIADDDFNAVVAVTDPNGKIDLVDNDIEGGTETVVVGQSVSGRYLVNVTGSFGSEGEFELSVRSMEAVAMRIGETKSGTIGAVAEFTLDSPDAQTLIVEITPTGDLDAGLRVTDPNEHTFTADYAHDASAERIAVDGSAKGQYLISVSGSGAATGRFELSVRSVNPDEIAVGDTREGTITRSAPVAVYEFKAGEAQPITVKVKSDTTNGLNAVLQVTDPNGQVQIVNLDSKSEPGAETDAVDSAVRGRYLVLVSGSEQTTGEFTLAVRSP